MNYNMWIELSNEDLEMILANLDESEKECLPVAYSIMQKIVGVINRKPGEAELVDTFKSIAANLSSIQEMKKQK